MPEWCVTMRCIDCSSHAIIAGKLDCNYLNRLGLAQPEVKSFISETYQTPEQIQSQMDDLTKQQKTIDDEKARIEELQKEQGVLPEEAKKDGT